MGFGEVEPHPREASESARRIKVSCPGIGSGSHKRVCCLFRADGSRRTVPGVYRRRVGQPVYFFDGLFERREIPSPQVGSADAAFENQIADESARLPALFKYEREAARHCPERRYTLF